ncbi:MAG: PD-(D/E)XK nuclease family protein [Lachnospiraceae bacterium]|nr:PD-(D/E)XK nuclease family protein [Lachnospiraceae bacterium]
MSLQLLLGGAGTGKTRLLLERLIDSSERHPDRRHVILVPEQFTMETQREVVALHPRHAVMNIDILSFERLAYRVLGEVGRGDLKILTEMGENMLLRKAAGEHREELTVFGRSLGKAGFISRLMTMISELYQYGVTEEKLEETAERLADRPLLAGKLRDLRIFYQALNETRGENAIAAEELLSVLNGCLERSGFLRDAVVVLDGFTGFTPVQYEILEKMFRQTESVSLALTLPQAEAGEPEARPEELFYLSKNTLAHCRRLAAENGIAVETECLTKNLRVGENSALGYLERHFLRLGKREAPPTSCEGIRAVLLRNPRQEAEWAAAAISRLVREQGYRYREIAVVAGDLAEYRPYLEQAFRREGVPCFLDIPAGILGNPVVEYLRSGIQAVEKDFSYEAVFRHLKCGLAPLKQEALDALDNYVLACGIRGRKKWEQPFERVPDRRRVPDLEALNAAREAVCADLAPLVRCRADRQSLVREHTAALREMLAAVDASEQAQQLAQNRREAGEDQKAEECEKVCEFLLDFLDQMDALLGDEILPWQEFSDILDAGLGEARLGMLPTGLDLVQIGDVRRSRRTNVRVLFLLGLNDGLIPAPQASSGILSEWERALLQENAVELAPTAEDSANQELFYLYTLLTKPSEQLFLGCSKMGSDGTARRPSYLLTQMLKLLPGLRLEDAEETDWQERMTGENAAWDVLAETIRESSALPDSEELEARPEESRAYRELVRCLAQNSSKRFDRILTAAFSVYRGNNISAEAARALYGPELTGSVTRLEQYAACACAQFLAYGLRLTERRENTFTGADRGNYFHRVLEIFFRLIRERGLDRRSLSEEERRALAAEAVSAAAAADEIDHLSESAGGRHLAERWGDLAGRTIWALCRQLDQGDFEPEAFEMYFDGWSSGAMQFRLADGTRMVLRGVVDRLDVFEEGDRRYIQIVDYKTGSTRLDLNAIVQGQQLQLVVYLDAVTELQQKRFPDREIIPAGIYYYTVQDPLLECDGIPEEDEREKQILKELRMRGLTNAAKSVAAHQEPVAGDTVTTEQFRELRGYVRKKVQQFGQEIQDGSASALPCRRKKQTGCDYCVYSGVCGFDTKIPGYHFRKMTEQKKEAIWRQVQEEVGEGESDGGTVD